MVLESIDVKRLDKFVKKKYIGFEVDNTEPQSFL